MVRHFCQVRLVVVGVLFCFLTGRLDAQVEVNRETSLLAAVIANTQALRRGDVLVHLKHSADTTKRENGKISGGFYEENQYARLVFDYDSGRIACYFREAAETTDFNHVGADGEFVQIREQNWWASQLNHEEESVASHSMQSGRKVAKVGDSLVFGIRYPLDFRGTWFTGGFDHGNFENAKAGVSSLAGIKPESVRVSARGENTVLTIQTKLVLGPANEYPARGIYEFDPHSLMAVSRKLVVDYPQAKNSEFVSVETEWKEFEGVFVPQEIEIKQSKKLKGIEGPGAFGSVASEIRFHWFGVNEAIDERLWAEEQLSGREAVVQLTDPKRYQAFDDSETAESAQR